MDTTIPLFIQAGFLALTVVYFGLLIREFRNALNLSSSDSRHKNKIIFRIVMALAVWAVLISAWSLSGHMADFSLFPFNIMPVLIIPLVVILVVTFSKTLKEIIVHIPPQNLVRLQTFRIFVEILLWSLFIKDQLPVQMSFEGRNFDVLSGLSAAFVAYGVAHQKISRTGLIIWNLAGLALLANIIGIAVLSMPSPLRIFMNEPSNTIVGLFPVSWLPAFLVPLAYGLHFLSLRQLAIKETVSVQA